MTENDDYLWTGEGPVDPEVARLEELLEPLRWKAAAGPVEEAPDPGSSSARLPAWWLPVVAVLAAASILLLLLFDPTAEVPDTRRLVHGSRALDPGSLFVAEAEGQSTLRLGSLGTLRLEQGSRLWVDRLREEEIVLRLERGELSALVSADARPGLFNVDTPATRCVDLGCAYELVVEESGDTRVEVTLGRVAFRNGDAEAFVPAGAVCRASRERGAGTPYFPESAPELREVLEEFDAQDDVALKRNLARRLCELAAERVDALPLWHLLQEGDGEIRVAAAERLAHLAGTPTGIDLASLPALDQAQRAEWREYLWPDPYR